MALIHHLLQHCHTKRGKGDKSEFEITYGRNMDATYAYVTRHRLAVDRKHDAFKNRNVTVKYEVNWKTHEVKIKASHLSKQFNHFIKSCRLHTC